MEPLLLPFPHSSSLPKSIPTCKGQGLPRGSGSCYRECSWVVPSVLPDLLLEPGVLLQEEGGVTVGVTRLLLKPSDITSVHKRSMRVHVCMPRSVPVTGHWRV